MKIKPGFEVRKVCGENLIVGMGEKNIDFSHVITLNESSYFLWEKMQAGADTIDKLVEAMTEEYEVDPETARKDIESLVAQLIEYNVVEA